MLTTPADDRTLIRSQNRGSRVYAINGKDYPSVTTIVSNGEPKPALVGWAKKVTAEAAVNSHDLVGELINRDGDQAAIDHLKGAAYRQRDAAGALGSRLHEVAELEVLQGEEFPDPGDPAARQLLQHFRHFIKETSPEWLAVEAIVYNETHRYAGTMDAAATIPGHFGGEPVIVDWKSGSGVYGSFALQLAAYAHAESVIGPNGPIDWEGQVSREKAAVVHIVPSGWKLYEIDVSQAIFDAFLTCRDMAYWAMEQSNGAVGQVLAHGRATGGKTLKRKEPELATPDVVEGFGTRRRIVPPTLAK